jgi:tetratricopeptide (TPR) repeat protein
MIKTSIFAGKWKNVLQSGKLYISKFSSDTFIHCFMGEACRNLGRYQESLNHFSKARSLDAQNKGAIYGILMTYLAMEDWENLDQALNSSSYANYLDSDTIEYYSVICDAKLKKDSTQILKKVQEVYSKNPTDTVLMSILAEAYLDSGLPDLATGWFNRLISIDSENESSYLFLIDCYEELNDKTKLTKSYENYLKKWPQNISIRKEFIKYLALQEKWKKAADNIELLIPYSKHPMMLTRNLATYRRRSGDYQKSAMAYRTLLQENTDDRALMHKYIFCLVKLDLCENALNFAKLWHKNYGIDVDGALIESSLAVKIKDFDYAISILRSAFSKFKENPRIKTKLAQVYYEIGNDDMAYQFDSDYVIQMRKSQTKKK